MFRLYLILFFTLLSSFGYAGEKIALSQEEMAYIKKHPIVTIGGGESFEPLIVIKDDGSVIGIDREIADLIEEKTGLTIQFKVGVWSDIQKLAKEGKIDGLASITKTKERQQYFSFTSPYLSYSTVVVLNRSNPHNIYKKEDVQGKSVSVHRGNEGFKKLVATLGRVESVYYDDLDAVLNAVITNEVDFTVLSEFVHAQAKKSGVSELISTSFVVGQSNYTHYAFTKDKPLLTSIFNKALDSIGTLQLADIKQRWTKSFDQRSIVLTQKEKEYLYRKKQINVCIEPNWYPFEQDINGEHIGMSGDFFKNFSKKIQTPFHLVSTKDWSDSLAASRDGRCDVLALAMKTDSRDAYLSFTKPYLTIPLVIATQKQVPFVQGFEALKGKRVAIIKDWAFVEIIKNRYPGIKVLEVESIQDGLNAVSTGNVFGYIDALASISYQLQANQMDGIKIAGSLEQEWKLSVAIQKSAPTLTGIFEKLVDSIDHVERQNILNKYISVTYEGYIDYDLIYKIVGASGFVLLLTLLWVRHIRKEKIALDKLYTELKKKEERLEAAYKELEQVSMTDKLTNIYNRRKIDLDLSDEIDRCERNGGVFSLMLFDIDHFKHINDTYGHQVGDLFLSELCDLIGNNIRSIDMFGRWGGEEFLIISPDSSDETPLVRAERIRVLVENHDFSIVGHRSASFGVTTYKKDDTMDTMLHRADGAMYQAKQAGRNRVVEINNDD